MTSDEAAWEQRIVQDPAVMVGKPVVRGTRIPVERVIGELANTSDFAELFAIYPELAADDVRACLRFAAATLEKRGPRSVNRRSPAARATTA